VVVVEFGVRQHCHGKLQLANQDGIVIEKV
jgi:hypothetical protein